MLSPQRKHLTNVKSELKRLFVQGIDIVFSSLDQQLDHDSTKFNDFIHLKSTYNSYKKDLLYGLVSQADLDLSINKIRQALLHFIDSLQAIDFVDSQSDPNPVSSNRGRMLYQIPLNMPLEQESKCIVRIAQSSIDISSGLNDETFETSSIRIADIMLVNLIDFTESGAFSIRRVNDQEQFIDKEDFTQWMFFVKPTTMGSHPLILKISVIELINGVERKKDIVFEKQILVSATVPIESIDNSFVESELVINLGGTPLTTEKSTKLQTILSGIKKGTRVTLLLSLLFIVSSSFIFAEIREQWDWYQAKKEDKIERYQEYIQQYPTGKHVNKALLKISTFTDTSVSVNNPNVADEKEVVLNLAEVATKPSLPFIQEKEPLPVKKVETNNSPKDKSKSDLEPLPPVKDITPDTLVIITNLNGDVLTKKLNIGDDEKKINKAKLEALKSKLVKFPISKWEKELLKSIRKLKKLKATSKNVYQGMEPSKQKDFQLISSEADSLSSKFIHFSKSLINTLDQQANVNKVYTTTAFNENYFNAINNKITTVDANIYKVISHYMDNKIDYDKLHLWHKELTEISKRIDRMKDMVEE